MSREIVIFGEHLLNTLGQIRSFGKAGYRPDVIWLVSGAHSPAGSRYIRKYFEVRSIEEGITLLLNEFTGDEKRFLSTDSDRVIAALDADYDAFIQYFHFFNAKGELRPYLDKYAQCKLAEEFGLNTPFSQVVEADAIPDNLPYPVFTKSTDSLSEDWKKRSAICRGKDDLSALFSSSGEKTLLVQKYIEKKNEVAFEGISRNGGDEVFIPIQGEYDRLPKIGYGTLKHNGPCRMDSSMKKAISGIMRKVGFSGVFEIEFIKDSQERLYFLEINFRHTQYNYALAMMGINMAEIWMTAVDEKSFSFDEFVIPDKQMTVFNEVKDFKDNVRTGKLTVRQWLKDFLHADSHYLYCREDPVFALRFLTKSLLLSLKLIKR